MEKQRNFNKNDLSMSVVMNSILRLRMKNSTGTKVQNFFQISFTTTHLCSNVKIKSLKSLKMFLTVIEKHNATLQEKISRATELWFNYRYLLPIPIYSFFPQCYIVGSIRHSQYISSQ